MQQIGQKKLISSDDDGNKFPKECLPKHVFQHQISLRPPLEHSSLHYKA